MRPENISAKTKSRPPGPRAAQASQRNLKVLAIPYYNQLVRSNGGLEHIYFKLMVDPITGEYSKPKLCVWNPKELPTLPDWLCQEGVEAVLCSDNRPGFEGLFSATGITLYWNQRGEVADMVSHWLHRIEPENQWRRPRMAFA